MFRCVLPLEDIAIVLNSILPNYSKKGLFAFHPALFLSASKDLQLIKISQLKVEPMILRQDQCWHQSSICIALCLRLAPIKSI
jgi:hypothetical protein